MVAAAATPYPAPNDPLRLLVFGGSQGARVMADIVPVAIGRLDAGLRRRLAIVQQAREEDIERVREAYANASVAAEIAPFFADLPARMAASHLVISRSGASTVAELAAIGRPSILVPLPHAIDQDQLANAGVLDRAGGALRIVQDDFTPERLAGEIEKFAAAPQRLATMAAAARSWAGSMPPTALPTWSCGWRGAPRNANLRIIYSSWPDLFRPFMSFRCKGLAMRGIAGQEIRGAA